MALTVLSSEKKLRIHEVYASIQGETTFSGLPTLFIRLAGCPLRCRWCDTEYAFGRGDAYSIDQICDQVQESQLSYVCLTGGEPLAQPTAFSLITRLCDLGVTVSIETGGSISIQNVDHRAVTILDIKCPESGESEKMHWENLATLRDHDEVKFVIANRNDYDYAKSICEKYSLYPRPRMPLFSPVWGEVDLIEFSDWIMKDKLPCRLNLQLHKVIWGSDAQNV